MKRVRVYKEIISDENLRLAIQEVNAGHRRNGNHSLNKKVIEIENNMDEYVEKLRAFIQGLVDGDEHMHPPIKRRRWDRNADSGKGKWRDINEPLLWPDQYVHHAVVQPMIPHIMRSMDRYCIASVPGRGNSYGVKALKKWMKNDVDGTKYCCECDIYHCFEELDPPYVIEALKRVFKDTETLWLCDAIMEYGVLIGAFFSAWFLHLTLQPLDLMIHQKQYGVSHYLRQMDNFTIFGSNKRKLRRLLEDIKKSPYDLKQIITMASLIEKESIGDDTERKNISSVIHNRLENPNSEKGGRTLQLCSTINYIMVHDGVKTFDTTIDNVYNTYIHESLTPGPICNPGLSAIKAAIYPADTDYYFFALGTDKKSHFFTDYTEHLRFVNSAEYQPIYS